MIVKTALPGFTPPTTGAVGLGTSVKLVSTGKGGWGTGAGDEGLGAGI